MYIGVMYSDLIWWTYNLVPFPNHHNYCSTKLPNCSTTNMKCYSVHTVLSLVYMNAPKCSLHLVDEAVDLEVDVLVQG